MKLKKKPIFSYNRLADEIDDDQIKTLFEKLDGCDFEGVIRDIKFARRMKLILDHFFSQKNTSQDQDENYLLNVAERVKIS